jgi:hypothetical protein
VMALKNTGRVRILDSCGNPSPCTQVRGLQKACQAGLIHGQLSSKTYVWCTEQTGSSSAHKEAVTGRRQEVHAGVVHHAKALVGDSDAVAVAAQYQCLEAYAAGHCPRPICDLKGVCRRLQGNQSTTSRWEENVVACMPDRKSHCSVTHERGRSGHTLKVLDAELLYRSCVRHEGLMHDVEGTQVSELPVSKHPVNCFGGVPIWNTPKYCTSTKFNESLLSVTYLRRYFINVVHCQAEALPDASTALSQQLGLIEQRHAELSSGKARHKPYTGVRCVQNSI